MSMTLIRKPQTVNRKPGRLLTSMPTCDRTGGNKEGAETTTLLAFCVSPSTKVSG